MQSEVDTTQEENTRFLDQANMMQKDNSDITGELSNMVANYARSEEEIVYLNNMSSYTRSEITQVKSPTTIN